MNPDIAAVLNGESRGCEDICGDMIDMIYSVADGDEDLMRYHQLHGTPSLLILTQYSQKIAAETARLLGDKIDNKRVIEIGAGVGFLAMEISKRAKSVLAVEVDPAWSWVFTRILYRYKLTNLSWYFGSAEHLVSLNPEQFDLAIIATRSGKKEMREVAHKLSSKVICLNLDLCKK